MLRPRSDVMAQLETLGAAEFIERHRGHLFLIISHLRESPDGFAFATMSPATGASGVVGAPKIADLLKNGRLQPLAKITIGRTANNDLALEDSSVSKFHAFVKITRDLGFELVDAGSTNGTVINGFELEPREPVALASGDTLKIGKAFEAKAMDAKSLADYLHIARRLGI